MCSGREFQMWAAATGKARLPTVASLTGGTTRRLVPAERRALRPGTSTVEDRGSSLPRGLGWVSQLTGWVGSDHPNGPMDNSGTTGQWHTPRGAERREGGCCRCPPNAWHNFSDTSMSTSGMKLTWKFSSKCSYCKDMSPSQVIQKNSDWSFGRNRSRTNCRVYVV